MEAIGTLFALLGFAYLGITVLQLQKQVKLLSAQQADREALEEALDSFVSRTKESNEQVLQGLLYREGTDDWSTEVLGPLMDNNEVEAVKAYRQPEPSENEESEESEISLASRVFQLADSGMSHEEIARTLSLGVTEVSLMLKFYQISS
ncbi:DUF6115 domain-containing protein [Shouchella shacheensis]|uniref:DUF6115 domain-containing protein n=1 Tax=Shouchella shacheensis TaxID=1649580 RepID=UPI0007404E47|nr:hypothetical protein [Shouchella shacheensis]